LVAITTILCYPAYHEISSLSGVNFLPY